MGRLKILMVIPQLGYGGAESAFLRVAKYLSREADVTLALMARDYGAGSYSTSPIEIDLPVILLDGDRQVGQGVFSKLARWWCFRHRLMALKAERDITISFLSGANLLNAMAGSTSKTIVSERGSKQFDPEMSAVRRWLWCRILDPLIYRQSVFVIAASEGLAREISSRNALVSNRIIGIEGTISTEQLVEMADDTIEVEFDDFRKYQTIIAFGRLHRVKGLDQLVRVFAHVRDKLPNARLLIIGDGPEMESLISLAAELGLRAGKSIDPKTLDVVFAGYRSNPLRYGRVSHLYAMPSFSEGLPNSLIEAVASGIEVISADCPWGPRSVLAGENDIIEAGAISYPRKLTHGTLMPILDSPAAQSAWAREIVARLEMPVPRQDANSRRKAIRRFDIEITGAEWMNTVLRALKVTNQAAETGRALRDF